MTTAAMMAEIREIYSDAEIVNNGDRWPAYELRAGGTNRWWGDTPYKLCRFALQAVRAAQPKPLTVAEAKAVVRGRWEKAHAEYTTLVFEPFPAWYIFPLKGDRYLAKAHSEGAAWKAAARAVGEEGR